MSAELQSPTRLPPTQNFAPILPLLKLQRGGSKPSSRIADVLKERFQHFHRKDREVFREIFNVGQLINYFFDGKQFPVRNPIDGSYGILPIIGNANTNSDRRALNILNNIKTNLLGKWENSNPDVVIRPGRNLDTCVSAAKAADTINNFYERQFYTHWFTQQEALGGMTFGTYIDRYRFDDSKKSLSVISDIFEQKDVAFGEGYGFCGSCQYGGTASEFNGGCPECKSTAVSVENPATDSIQSLARQESRQHGDLVCELLPLPACRFDLAKRPEDSGYFIYRQDIPKGSVTRVLGNVLLPQGNADSDYGLEVLRTLQKQGAALGGYSRGGRNDRDKSDSITFDEMWLSPDCYADINLMGDEETVDGERIPKGKLTDAFPDGLCAVGLNGMAVVLALYHEQQRNHIVSGTWFMQSQTGAGRGLADSIEVQKQFNTLNSQAVSYMSATYTPAVGYDNQIWSGNKMKYIGTPRTNIPFDLTKLPDGRKLHDSIYQFQPTAIPSQFFNYAQDFMGYLFKKTSGASDYDQGDPGIAPSNPTATAAEIDQGNADSFNQPIFLIKGDARCRGSEITIDLFRKHFPMKRYFALTGRYGQQQGIELSGADVKADLTFEVAKNSEMPKGPFTRQKNRVQFFNTIGGIDGLIAGQQAFPKVISNVAQDFDVDLDIIEDFDAVAELCRKRLDQVIQASKVGVDDPTILIGAIQPPISAKEPNLADKGKWFANWLDTDQGQNASMPVRAAAEMLADGQISGQAVQDAEAAMQQGTVAASGAAPAMLGQHALEMNAQQPESTEPDPTAVLQMQQEQSQQQHEASESAAEHEREMQRMDKEHAHAKAESRVDATEKIRLERAKPKPKPAVKGDKK